MKVVKKSSSKGVSQSNSNKKKLNILTGDYGFIPINNMPKGKYKAATIDIDGINWATTGEFSNVADNHCGATAATNIALYFHKRGYTNLLNKNKHDTFTAIHKVIGNGPVAMIAGGTKKYFNSRGYPLKYGRVSSFNGIKKAIANQKPCGVLLAAGILDWHWVICVGWREYSTGEKYLQIVNGWNNSANYFFKVNNNVRLRSTTEYGID